MVPANQAPASSVIACGQEKADRGAEIGSIAETLAGDGNGPPRVSPGEFGKTCRVGYLDRLGPGKYWPVDDGGRNKLEQNQQP